MIVLIVVMLLHRKAYRNLKALPEWDKPDFEKNQIVIKFECKRIETENT